MVLRGSFKVISLVTNDKVLPRERGRERQREILRRDEQLVDELRLGLILGVYHLLLELILHVVSALDIVHG